MNDPILGDAPKIPQLPPKERPLGIIACPKCRMENEVEAVGVGETNCQFCRAPISFRIFPRLTKAPPKKLQPHPAEGGDATCQFYPELKAEVICDECGCFMSEKASVNWDGKTFCLPCLHNLREQKADTNYRASLKIWDNRALGLLAMLPLTLFTGPIALFVLLRFRKEPVGWVPRGRFRWWLALVFSIIVLSGWTALVIVWVAMLTRELS